MKRTELLSICRRESVVQERLFQGELDSASRQVHRILADYLRRMEQSLAAAAATSSSDRYPAGAVATPTGSGPTMLEIGLADLLNRHSAENSSNTPDFLLSEYLLKCLAIFNSTVLKREDWYGHRHSPGAD